MSDSGDRDMALELIEVRLVDMSLPAYSHSTEHHDELLREFALIQSREPTEGHNVPRRLLAVIDTLNNEYAGMTALPQADLQAALERGDPSIDLVYHMPPAVGPACAQLLALLREADDYCRHGDLLTLAPPPDAVAFREWLLLEFVNQVEGKPPTPWPAFLADHQLQG